eukprot:UN06674
MWSTSINIIFRNSKYNISNLEYRIIEYIVMYLQAHPSWRLVVYYLTQDWFLE